nr:MAG TPA: Receptor Binding Protein [Caudoviricetes sp.]
MAELYFPFASVSGDRKVGPEIYERMLGDMFTAGVFPRGEMLAVAPAGGMQITLKTGGAVLIRTDATSAGPRGYLYSNTAAQTLTCNVADGVAGRIDAVVLRWSRTARSVTAAIVTGTPAATPTAPALTRTADTWEMCLAQISVAAGTTEITAAQITDTRETELCGIASSIAQLDSAEFYAQQTAVFDAWFGSIKDTLEGDVAGQLAAQIATLQQHTEGVTCEVYNGSVTLTASAWTENAAKMRKEYKLQNAKIKTSSNARVILPNALAGTVDIQAEPRPYNGYMILYTTDAAPTEDIEVQLIVEEVRIIE